MDERIDQDYLESQTLPADSLDQICGQLLDDLFKLFFNLLGAHVLVGYSLDNLKQRGLEPSRFT